MKTSRNIFLIAVFLYIINVLPAQESYVKHVDWSKNAVIYEVNIRQYTNEGTFNAFAEHLPRLKEMGIDILWLMPIHPIGSKNRKGTLGSYYAVKDYKAVNPNFGSMEDFKNLVDKIHDMDMYVVIDWVANHSAWDNELTLTNPQFYNRDSTGNFYPPVQDWNDVIDFNYDDEELQNYMLDAMKFWVEECGIDGYRCDVAGMVPTEFWNKVRKELDKIKPVFMLAEAEEPDLHEYAFDMTYAWDLHHLMNKIAQGDSSVDALYDYWEKERERFPRNAYRMIFTSNHDENSWNGTVFERLGDAAETMIVLSSTVEGMPLVYNGQEAGMDKRLEFFEKDPIEWKDHKFYDIYKKLFLLKEKNKALWNGNFGGKLVHLNTGSENVYAFTREKENNRVIAVFNLSDTEQTAKIKNDRVKDEYTNLFTSDKYEFDNPQNFTLHPWEYIVLYK